MWVVPAGRELAIMVQQEITLDYEPNGRKLDYGAQIDRSRSGLGWASSPPVPRRTQVLPQDGPTMLDIYYGHFEGRPPTPETAAAQESGAGAPGALRQRALGVARDRLALREEGTASSSPGTHPQRRDRDRALFPTLPNPQIVLYVSHGHLAGPERLPVPGYSTAFGLYPRTEYSLPGGNAAAAAARRPQGSVPAATAGARGACGG